MKLFETALDNLQNILEYKEIPSSLDNVTSGILRNLRRIDYAIKKLKKHRFSIASGLQNILRTGVYLIVFDKDFQNEIAVNTAVEYAKKEGFTKQVGFVNAVLRKMCNANWRMISTPAPDNYPAYLATLHSHPDYLVNRWIKRWGRKEAERILASNNRYPPRYFRVNQNKISVDELYSILEKEMIPFNVH